MPTAAELLIADGWTAPEKGTDNLSVLIEASDEMRGLVSTKDDLLQWKQSNAEKVTGYEAMEAKQVEDLNEREQLAIKNKDYEAQINIINERALKQDAIIKTRNQQALTGKQESAEMEFASLFSLQENGLSHAKNIITHSMDDDGNVNRSYKFEGNQYSSLDEMKPALAKSWIAPYMKGPESSGPTHTGGDAGSTKQTRSTMKPEQKAEYITEHGQEAYLQLEK